jgi:hypothetical protein
VREEKIEDDRDWASDRPAQKRRLTKVVDLSHTTADKMLPVMVANKTFLRPYRSDTTVSPIMKARLTRAEGRTNETLAETE